METPGSRPNVPLLAAMAIVVGLSVYGFYTSLHLMDIHYRQPGRTAQFFEDFPFLKFLEPGVPKKYKVPVPEIDEAVKVKDTAEEELQHSYNVFAGLENPGPAAEGQGGAAPIDDPYADIQKQNPKKWLEEQKQAQGGEVCDINENWSCKKVDQSKHSSVGGIAVSAIGAAGYLALLVLGIVALAQRPTVPNLTVAFIWTGTIIGFAYSIYLTYLEAFVIGVFCPYCVASALAMAGIFAVMFALAIVEERRA
jgi:uncharacterized membrane protein